MVAINDEELDIMKDDYFLPESNKSKSRFNPTSN